MSIEVTIIGLKETQKEWNGLIKNGVDNHYNQFHNSMDILDKHL